MSIGKQLSPLFFMPVNAILQTFGRVDPELRYCRMFCWAQHVRGKLKSYNCWDVPGVTLANNSAKKSDEASWRLGLTSRQSQKTEAPLGNSEKSRAKGKGGQRGLRSVEWQSVKHHVHLSNCWIKNQSVCVKGQCGCNSGCSMEETPAGWRWLSYRLSLIQSVLLNASQKPTGSGGKSNRLAPANGFWSTWVLSSAVNCF